MQKNKYFLTLLVVVVALAIGYFMFSMVFGNRQNTDSQNYPDQVNPSGAFTPVPIDQNI